ncbi:MAG: hypothetical protein IJ489_06830 [Clostridia bacterium]|nr:hypothetical protein [Clostridia bacterium]
MSQRYGTAEAYDRFLSYDEAPEMLVIDDFSSGMAKDTALLLNMEVKGKSLISVAMPEDAVYEGGFAEGSVTDAAYADGVFLFRKGRTLYALKDGAFFVVGTEGMLTEDRGAIYDCDQRFYVIDGEYIYVVERGLSITLMEQSVPVCLTGLSRSGAYYTEVAPMNPFCRYIDMWLSDEEGNEQLFPLSFAVDNTYARAWHKDGTEVYNGYVMLREDRVIFDGDDAAGCRLRLRLSDSEDASVYSFSSSAEYREIVGKSGTAFPVSLSDGTVMLLTANGTEIIGVSLPDGFGAHSTQNLVRYDCLQDITDIVPFDDGYLVFFEDAVKKLSIKDGTDGISFSVTSFQNDFGSDMKGSIVCFDDKIVFASAKEGIFCIDRFGISEKVGRRKISANIEEGEYGFFSHTAEEYESASGFAAFGKYYLSVGAVTYVWDHRAKLPTGTQTHAHEAAMIWYLTDTIRPEKYLAFLAGGLYYTERDTGKLRYLKRSGGSVASKMQTAELDLGSCGEKTLIGFGMRYRSSGTVSVSVICDGKVFPDTYHFPASENFVSREIRTYGKRFEKISLFTECEGKTEMDAIIFRFLL